MPADVRGGILGSSRRSHRLTETHSRSRACSPSALSCPSPEWRALWLGGQLLRLVHNLQSFSLPVRLSKPHSPITSAAPLPTATRNKRSTLPGAWTTRTGMTVASGAAWAPSTTGSSACSATSASLTPSCPPNRRRLPWSGVASGSLSRCVLIRSIDGKLSKATPWQTVRQYNDFLNKLTSITKAMTGDLEIYQDYTKLYSDSSRVQKVFFIFFMWRLVLIGT
jgi:hypothetical protein